jgi:hypothetical protein
MSGSSVEEFENSGKYPCFPPFVSPSLLPEIRISLERHTSESVLNKSLNNRTHSSRQQQQPAVAVVYSQKSSYSSPVEEIRSLFRFGNTQGQQGGRNVASFNPIGG